MGLSRETVQAVKERSDILEIVGEKVSLQRAGADFKGLCPFHQEKTPSFIVSPSKRMYKCFGCGSGGSVIDFVMASDRVSFAEAVESLARRLGLQIAGGGPRRPEDPVPRLLQEAQTFYHERLVRSADARVAREYLSGRGFDEQDWKAFGLGYAPQQWQSLTDRMAGAGFAQPAMVASGLIRAGGNGRLYDFMRHRVIFPIHDVTQRCIGFGGRAIAAEDAPKYLNTPETPYYQKHRVLFGLAQGADAIRRSRRAILCEGYLDVIRLHRAGFREAVATCGTALTPHHLQTLERYAERALLVFDGDTAGIKAALRGVSIFLESRLEAHVVTLPDGLDPDDFIKARGPAAFAALAKRATPILEFAVEQTLRQHGPTVHGRQQALAELLPILVGIRKETARAITLAHVAHLLEMPIEAVTRALASARPRPAARADAPPAAPAQAALRAPTAPERHQRRMLAYLLRERELLAQVRSLVEPAELTDPDVRLVFDKLLRLTDEEFRALDVDELLWMFPEAASHLQSFLLDEPVKMSNIGDYQRALLNDVREIKKATNKRLRERLLKARGTADEEALLRQVKETSDQIERLKSASATRAPDAAGTRIRS